MPAVVDVACVQVRGFPCDCQWPEQCDSQQSSLPPTRMSLKAQQPSCSPPGQTTARQPHMLHPLAPPSHASQSTANRGHTANAVQQMPTTVQPLPLLSPIAPHQAAAAEPPDVSGAADAVQQAMPEVTPSAEMSTKAAQAATTVTEAGPHTATQEAGQAELQRLEQEFVHNVYDAIAPHFSATRFAIWPKVGSPTPLPLASSHCTLC